jgi:hypothetical protein
MRVRYTSRLPGNQMGRLPQVINTRSPPKTAASRPHHPERCERDLASVRLRGQPCLLRCTGKGFPPGRPVVANNDPSLELILPDLFTLSGNVARPILIVGWSGVDIQCVMVPPFRGDTI